MLYTNIARWFCKAASGHDRVWPQWANHTCPKCGKEFNLSDRILVTSQGRVYHYDCYQGRKPPFREQVET